MDFSWPGTLTICRRSTVIDGDEDEDDEEGEKEDEWRDE